MWHRFTKSSKAAVMEAYRRASDRKSFLVGPEDLVLGAIKAEGSLSGYLLEKAGLSQADFIQAVSNLPTDQGRAGILKQVGFSVTGKVSVDRAIEETKRFGSSKVTTEHLFLGAIRVSPEIQEILKAKGLVVDDLRQKLVELLDEPKSRP